MPGAAHLRQSELLCRLVTEQVAQGRLMAAICAAPAVVLEDLGLLDVRPPKLPNPEIEEKYRFSPSVFCFFGFFCFFWFFFFFFLLLLLVVSGRIHLGFVFSGF